MLGLPFRGLAARNQNPNSMIPVSVIAFFIGTVLLISAAVRLARYSDAHSERVSLVSLVLGISLGLCVAGAVLLRQGLRRVGTDASARLDAQHSAPGRGSFAVLAVALILLGASLVLIVLVGSR